MRWKQRGLWELFHSDPEQLEGLLRAEPSRRRFLKNAGASVAGFSLASIPFGYARHARPTGTFPTIMEGQDDPVLEGKDGLIVLNERPVNAETPIALLDERVTSNAHHFVRNNGLVPERARQSPSGKESLNDWRLTIDGELDRPLELSLADLQSRFDSVTLRLVLECGGNGRAGFQPPASGNQWKLGAVGCAEYRGVRLKDVLEAAAVRTTAVYVAYYGEDPHLSGDPEKVAISRGVPIAKAMEEHTLLAWEMNGEPLPAQHGFPLRLVAAGFPASASGKWLRRLWVRDRVHDGEKMGGYSYRVPRHPVAPGTEVPQSEMEIIEAMPVKSIMTHPTTGASHPLGRALAVRGHAWSGDSRVSSMHLSIDFGQTWLTAKLEEPHNPFAWQHFSAEVRFPIEGHYEVWARATDTAGRTQPMVIPGWNPRGYLNNAMQRIAVQVTA